MKKPNTIRHFTNNMQRAALAVCMAALVALTAGSAHALTTTSVIDLGAQGSGTALGGGAKVEKIAKAALPVGSILRSVAIDARIDAGDPYVGDICVFFASSSSAPGTLRVGDNYDGGAPGAATEVIWDGGNAYGVGETINKTITAGIPAIDLNEYAVYLTSGWNGTWSGTVTLTYDVAQDPNTTKDILTFTSSFGPATISGNNITVLAPVGMAVTALSPTYTHNGASASPSSGTTRDFTNPQTYTVTAVDGSTNTYTVTVTPWAVTNGLSLWLDASTLTGLNDGDTVDSWTDMSGQNNTATKTYGSPIYKTGQIGANNQPVVGINGGNLNFNRISNIRSVFWVLKEYSTADRFLLGDTDNYAFHRGGSGRLWSGNDASSSVRNGTTKLMGTVVDGTTTTFPTGTFQLVSLVTTGDVPANNVTKDRSNRDGWNGDIAEILIYNTALTANQEAIVGSYLAAKYALTTAYPSAVAAAATTTSLVTSGSPSTYGGAVTLTATVAPTPNGGTVQFYDNAVALGSPVSVNTSTGQAQLITSDLTAGSHALTATYSGTSGFSGSTTASATTQTVNVANQTITFGTLVSKSYGDEAFLLTGTASSGLTVSYTSSDPLVASISGSTVTILKAGSTTITASQSGDANYNAATNVPRTLTVNKGNLTYQAPSSAGQLINVSIGSASKSSPVGPAGGAGTTWNQFTWSGQWQDVTGSALNDSTGTPTAVGFEFGNQWNAFDPWGSPSLTLLSNGANPNSSETGTLSGLTVGSAYDIYIASYHGNDLNNGSFETDNSSSNGSTQNLDSTSSPNGSTWVEGQNYVLFQGVVANSLGEVNLTWNPTNRLAIMGFQIVAPGSPLPSATSITSGQPLSASTLSGTFVNAAGVAVSGTLAFTNPNEVPPVGTAAHGVTFTPTDTANYNLGSTSVDVTVTTSGDSFQTWIDTNYPNLSDKTPAGDPDNDGLSNESEYAFGLDPSSGSSCSPIVAPLDKTSGEFTYTRRATPATTNLSYQVWTSPDLSQWTLDVGAVQQLDSTVAGVETVTVTLSGAKPLAASKLFVRVTAD